VENCLSKLMQLGMNMWENMQFRLSDSQWYLVVGLVGLGLPLTVTIGVSGVSAMVSVRVSVN